MSKVLGPIHYWLYHKIRFQEELTDSIARLAAEKNWTDKTGAITETEPEDRPLEDLIDQDNIHGWLQAKITEAERRYAALVTGLLREDPARLNDLKEAAYAFGKEHADDAGESVIRIPGMAGEETAAFRLYRQLDASLLNGMPCDGVNVVTGQSEDELSFEETKDLHSSFWKEAGGSGDIYRVLRAEVSRGLLYNSGYSLRADDACRRFILHKDPVA